MAANTALRRQVAYSAVLVVLLAAAIVTAAVLILTNGSESTSVSQTGGGADIDPPADLTIARDGLPRYEGTIEYAANIYTGGSILDAVYFVSAAPATVAAFYETAMTADGWATLTPATETQLESKDGKSDTTSAWTYSAARDGITATITTMASAKDATLGSTQISVHIERLTE